MPNPIEWFQTTLESSPNLETKLLSSLILILVLWLLRLFAIYLVNRRTADAAVRYRWRKTTTYLAVLLGLLLLGWIWLKGLQSIFTFIGLVAAGLVVALRDPLLNLAGWVFILWRRPFEVGDRIQIGAHAGDVIDLRIFQFSLLEIRNWVAADQSTGRVIHVPNGLVFGVPLANYSKGFTYIWHEIRVLVTFESDWEKAKNLLHEITDRHAAHLSQAAKERVERAARRFMIVYSNLTPTVYTRVEAHGVSLTIRYLCEPRRRRKSEHALWEEILRAFAAHPDIEFAYPTQRFYDRRREKAETDEARPATKG